MKNATKVKKIARIRCPYLKRHWGTCSECGELFNTDHKALVELRLCRKHCTRRFGSSERRKVSVTCQYCGNIYQRAWADLRAERKHKPDKPEVCSYRCLQFLRGTQIKVQCSQCGKEFMKWHKYAEASKHHFCSRECQDKNFSYILRGPAHYRFKDGSGINPRNPGWKRLKAKIRLRDEYTCRKCGISEPQSGRQLDVHHIKPLKECQSLAEANHPFNLISLCSSCHHRLEALCAQQPELVAEIYKLNVDNTELRPDQSLNS